MNGAEPIYGPPSHPTQIYEALCYVLIFLVLCWCYYRKDLARRNPGLMFGVGLIGIFLSRFFIEFVKHPQEAFEQNMTLDMGQWLSVPFVIAGVVMVIYGLKHKKTPPPLADNSFFPKSAAKSKEKASAQKNAAKSPDGKESKAKTASKKGGKKK